MKPEAVSFTEQNGQRAAVTPADLEKAALDQLARQWAPLLPTAAE
jgi:hypothetical protein